MAPHPEIADIEVSTSGKNGGGCPVSCPMCYKGNNSKPGVPDNMSLATFKQIFHKLDTNFLTQIAFGITSVGSHPELFDIFQTCRDNKVIPNVTINGSDPLTDDQINKLVKVTGAMAISVVPPRQENAYNLISRIIAAGGNQINIHYVIHKSSIDDAYGVCESMKSDPRLKGLNAIVFLGLKPKNRGQAFEVLPVDEYVKLVKFCLQNEVPFGFDSCSSPKTELAVVKSDYLDDDIKNRILQSCERCESFLYSMYINAEGVFYPCSFGEEIEESIDVLKVNDFNSEVWNSDPARRWRERLSSLNRECPIYPEIRIEQDKS
jgi:MoaA/NifB/PqqE/SkfB family radical SAM enzyme